MRKKASFIVKSMFIPDELSPCPLAAVATLAGSLEAPSAKPGPFARAKGAGGPGLTQAEPLFGARLHEALQQLHQLRRQDLKILRPRKAANAQNDETGRDWTL